MGARFDYENLRREYRIEYPPAFNYAFDVIDRKAVEDRNRTAMIWVGENGGERRLTFWELSIASNRAANYLQSIGVEKGDRVAIMLPRVPEWWIVVLASGQTPSSALVRELQDHVRKVTAPYKYPREIEFVSELPKTISGKIRRVELRSRETENPS